MKAESYIIISELVRSNILKRISQIPCDGKTQIRIGNAGGKRSAAINRLMWMWYGEIQEFIRAHHGQVSSTDDIHEFMVNLLLPKKVVEINGISKAIRRPTSKMNNKEMSEYLELVDHYCGSDMGLALTHPIDLYTEAMK